MQRRLDERPSPQELQMQQDLITNKDVPKASGYGVPKKFDPPKPPEKPGNLPEPVKKWLNDTEVVGQSSVKH